MSKGIDQARIRKALDELLYLAPLKEEANTDGELGAAPTTEVAGGGCQPWDRHGLERRLQSFKV